MVVVLGFVVVLVGGSVLENTDGVGEEVVVEFLPWGLHCVALHWQIGAMLVTGPVHRVSVSQRPPEGERDTVTQSLLLPGVVSGEPGAQGKSTSGGRPEEIQTQ